MSKGKKHTPEQIVSLLRQIEVAVANGKTTPVACREYGITEQTYYRWRKEYGGLQVDQARRLKELVLPLSALYAMGPYTYHDLVSGFLVHMVFVGLPISFSMWLFARQPE